MEIRKDMLQCLKQGNALFVKRLRQRLNMVGWLWFDHFCSDRNFSKRQYLLWSLLLDWPTLSQSCTMVWSSFYLIPHPSPSSLAKIGPVLWAETFHTYSYLFPFSILFHRHYPRWNCCIPNSTSAFAFQRAQTDTPIVRPSQLVHFCDSS